MAGMVRRILGFVLCALAGAAAAQTATPPTGEYLAERGWGVLLVKPGRDGRVPFDLQAMGGNMHSCSLDGTIERGRAVLEGDGSDKPCIVTFAAKGDGIEVTSNGACRNYCGARAGFEQIYLRPASGCTRAEVRRARDDFKRLYDRKAYGEARSRLEPVLASCSRTLWYPDEGWIRNDLAITLHRLGDQAACRRVLEKYAEEAALPDAEILANHPPSDGATILPILKAARTNLKLCRAAASVTAPAGR